MQPPFLAASSPPPSLPPRAYASKSRLRSSNFSFRSETMSRNHTLTPTASKHQSGPYSNSTRDAPPPPYSPGAIQLQDLSSSPSTSPCLPARDIEAQPRAPPAPQRHSSCCKRLIFILVLAVLGVLGVGSYLFWFRDRYGCDRARRYGGALPEYCYRGLGVGVRD